MSDSGSFSTLFSIIIGTPKNTTAAGTTTAKTATVAVAATTTEEKINKISVLHVEPVMTARLRPAGDKIEGKGLGLF